MLSHFDELYRRLDFLRTEYQALEAAVLRLEERAAADESKFATRAELLEISERVATLSRRVDELEADV
ncbi:MAG TPA: hypothetical protein VHL59_01275 [Thermoanaerobaculia bacterium]|nr:hypothetical protein [Thermoanaerobaculia bacterium]